MANEYKDIIITPNKNQVADPKIEFKGGNTTSNVDFSISVTPDANGALLFSGASGNLFQLSDSNIVFGTANTDITIQGNLHLTSDITELGSNSNVKITGGSNSQVLMTDGAGNLRWTSVSTGGGVVISIVAGNGIVVDDTDAANPIISANIPSVANSALTANTVTDNSQPNITSVGTLTSLAVTGNISSGNISATNGAFTNVSGNGANLTNITAANVNGFVPNAVHANTATTITANAQPNITSVGTLTSLSVTGNISTGNISGNGASLTSITGANVTGFVPNAVHANTATSSTTSGTVTSNSQPNITSVGTLSSLAVTGNITYGNISGGNLISANFITGTINTGIQPNITGVGTLANLTVTGNVSAGNISATRGNFTNVSGNGANLTSIAGGNVTGFVANATIANTVRTNAQPNITSVGTLTSLSVTGNISSGNISANNGVFTSVSGNGSGLTGVGNVAGPGSAVSNNHVVLFDGTTGRSIKDGGKLLPSGNIVGTTDTQTITTKTFGNYTETVFTISDGASVNLDPNNGPIQLWTLGANRTPGQANWNAGQSITLMIDDGTARTINWSTLAVVWKTDGGIAPTLNTTGFTVVVLWKVSTTIYGARVGNA